MTSPSTQPGSPSLRAIETALARAATEVPALAPLLAAFGPLFAARAELRASAPGWSGPAPALDAERFTQGVFVLAQMEHGQGFQDMSAHLAQAAQTLLPVMVQSFPAVAQELNILSEAIASGALPLEDLAAAGFGETVQVPGVGAETLAFAASELVRPFVERQAQDLLALVKDLPWRQALCPVCGNAPDMSVLRRTSDSSEFIQAHGGQRFLRCSCCASEWAYKRVSCPTCGCEDPDGLMVLRAPIRLFERADACTRCNTFILCLDTGEMVDIPDLDVAALTMLPLELQAKAQGYAPLARHPWGDL
ncbi:MAG: formate dehydrogenase accessory protein FdhE [Humidesulfovibrio sp.]|nr:formate dehydrogenase accessory protein FdhE [Humidesulfovibrio sp.]